jgi:predicted HTH domain antitoxin
MLGTLDVSETRLGTRLKELIAIELFREGRISSGKGAELLGVPKVDFIRLLGRYGIFYFAESPEDLVRELAAVEKVLDEAL